MCDDHPESLLHCLWPYPYAQSVWRSEITFANLYTTKHRSFFDLLDGVMQNSLGYHVALLFTIAWSLWQRRNRLRENQGTWPLHEVGDRAKAMVVEFLEANKHISNLGLRLVAQWSPPPENCYKVNFDASMFDHLGCANIRVVVRDHRGEVMAALSQKIVVPQLVALAEAWAAHRVVTFAQEMSFFRIQVEGYFLGIICALQSHGQCKTLFGHMIDDTQRLGYALHSCQFFHVRWVGNKLAHELARRAVLSADTDV